MTNNLMLFLILIFILIAVYRDWVNLAKIYEDLKNLYNSIISKIKVEDKLQKESNNFENKGVT